MFLNLCKVDSKEREGYHIPVRERIRQIILEIAEKEGVKVSQIILFGSRTRGQARSDSDWDVLVTTEEELSFKEKWEVIDKIKRKLARLRIPNDIIFKSRQEFEKQKKIPGLISYEVNLKGVKL